MKKIQGRVVKGKGEATKLGYPTANLEYWTARAPEPGVWTCEATVNGKKISGLAIIGIWEIGNGLPSFEVHLLGVNQDFYDQTFEVKLGTKIRDLIHYSDPAELVSQIQKDIAAARVLMN